MALTETPFLIRAGRIKVTQRNGFQPPGPIAVGQNLFDDQLRTAIGIDRRLWMHFVDRGVFRLAKYRCRRRKNESADIELVHYLQ